MASERTIGRYRRWYARLLRLYPRPYHERFAEPMAQTFTDLCREHREATGGLHAFALGTFAETSAGIMREHMTKIFRKGMTRWVIATAVILSLPLLAMLFRIGVPDPGSGTDGVNWGPFDFVAAGVLLLGTGFLYELARRAGNTVHRIAVGMAVGGALLLVWGNLAAGMIGDEDNPANLMYVAVLAVGLIGAYLARLQPAGMARALFATALAQALVAVIALVGGFGPTLALDAFFIGLWVASGLLFRQASLASAPSR